MKMQISHVIKEKGDIINNRIVPFFRKKSYLVALLFCMIVGATYFYCAARIWGNIFGQTIETYYTYLLDAFLHGHTNVPFPPNQLDLSWFENKSYLYWGPAPVLFILPFYLVSHLQASNILYTAIGGTVNVALFYLVMQEFKKFFQIFLSFAAEAFLVLSFGLASPNFFLSVAGDATYTSQIFAVTYLLLFYLLYFRFLKSEKHWQLILCTVFFCLACLSRYTLVFHGILFVYLFVHGKMSGRAIPTKIILSLTLIMFAFVSLEALYNFVRFHNPLETGARFQVGGGGGDSEFIANLRSNQILSLRYFHKNVFYCFINIVHFSFSPLSVVRDVNGNSIFFVYPALLLLPTLFRTRKYADRKRMLFLIIAGSVIGLSVLFFMLCVFYGTWQFGYRFFFDVLPLVFLLLIFILPSVPISIQMGLLAYGLFVNFYGIMAFYELPTDNLQLQATLFWIVLLTSLLAFLSMKEGREGGREPNNLLSTFDKRSIYQEKLIPLLSEKTSIK